MSNLIIQKLSALPSVVSPNTVYLIRNPDTTVTIYVTDMAGVVTSVVRNTIDRYDLPVATTTGALDLAKNQVFKIDLTTAGIRNITFTNPPVGRSTVIVLEVTGSVGTLFFPSTVKFADGTDSTPGAVNSIITIFYDGSAFFLVGNNKVS